MKISKSDDLRRLQSDLNVAYMGGRRYQLSFLYMNVHRQ